MKPKASNQIAVMTRETAEHFYAWLNGHVAEDEQHEVEQAIHGLLREHPGLVETHSWPEMRALARSYRVENGSER